MPSYVVQHGTGLLIQVNSEFRELRDKFRYCPECSSTRTYLSVHVGDDVGENLEAWVCMDCGEIF
jgi:uncharacterized protein with PIN domain